MWELYKYVRGGDPKKAEENLLTGIFCWSLEYNRDFSHEVLERSRCLSTIRGAKSLDAVPPFPDFDDIEVQFQKDLGESGTADFELRGQNLIVIGESKIRPEEFEMDQLKGYYDASVEASEGEEVLGLCVTPDKEEYIIKQLMKNPPALVDRFRWISWMEVWNICDKILAERGFNVIIWETKRAIEMCELKPFDGFSEGFDEVLLNIERLRTIGEFMDSMAHRLTSPDVDLEAETAIRHNIRVDHTYPIWVYKRYFEKTWKRKRVPSVNAYVVSFAYESPPEVTIALFFRRGDAYEDFKELWEQHPELLQELKDEFSPMGADVYDEYDNGQLVSVGIGSDNDLWRDGHGLLDFFLEVLQFLRENTVKALESMGYEF